MHSILFSNYYYVLCLKTFLNRTPFFRPRSTPEVSKYDNVFTLRTVDDANKIYQSLSSDCNLVVIGSSFIGTV